MFVQEKLQFYLAHGDPNGVGGGEDARRVAEVRGAARR